MQNYQYFRDVKSLKLFLTAIFYAVYFLIKSPNFYYKHQLMPMTMHQYFCW